MSVFDILRLHVYSDMAKLIIRISFGDNQPDEYAFILGNYIKCNELINDLANLRIDQEYKRFIYKQLIAYACQGGYKSIIDLMIDRKIEICFKDCIYTACEYGQYGLTQYIIKLSKHHNNDEILKAGVYGTLAGGHLTIIKLLFSDIMIDHPETFMSHACRSGDMQTIEHVLRLSPYKINVQNQRFYGIIFKNVCAFKDVDAVKLVMEKVSIDIAFECNIMWTGLSRACIAGNLPVVLFILKQPIKWHINYLKFGFIFTFQSGNVEFIMTILNTCKAINNKFNPDWTNGFLHACMKGHFEAAQLAILHEEHLDLDQGIKLACMSGNYKLMVNIVHEKLKREDSNAILTEKQIRITVRKVLLKLDTNYSRVIDIREQLARSAHIRMLKFLMSLFN